MIQYDNNDSDDRTEEAVDEEEMNSKTEWNDSVRRQWQWW